MKKYFTKYLPVDGELEEGQNNKALFKNKIFSVDQINYDLNNFEDFGENMYVPLKGSQKVKLFLCSKNIQVGDTLKECMPNAIEFKVHHFETVLPFGVYVMEPWPSDKEVWIRADKAFKTIGKVSPDAVWVTEGMEFDEEEVKAGDLIREGINEDTIVTHTRWGDRVKIIKRGVRFKEDHLCEYLDDANLNHSNQCIKGETFIYSDNLLGFTTMRYYKFKCSNCKTFH